MEISKEKNIFLILKFILDTNLLFDNYIISIILRVN